MNSDLQDPEVIAALTAAFTQLVEASLIEKKPNRAATVTPLQVAICRIPKNLTIS